MARPRQSHRGKGAAHATKRGQASFAAKGARHLLLPFNQAQIPLDLSSGERDGQIIQEREHLR
jgi:hypothetical protein